MTLKNCEVDEMLHKLEIHFDEPCLPVSMVKNIIEEWADLVEEDYCLKDDVPLWVTHLNIVVNKIKHNMSFKDECVIFTESKE